MKTWEKLATVMVAVVGYIAFYVAVGFGLFYSGLWCLKHFGVIGGS